MDKAKKKLLKRYLTWGGIAALVLLTVMPLLARSEAEADGPVASVLSAQVTRGDIAQTLHGGGTLEALGEEEVNLPTGVKITQFLVKNGDTVREGDPVALVDKVSVMSVITEVNETMKYLREELEDGRNEKVPSTIYATAGGRVKRVFVWPGDDVQETMLNHGALALLSIDGLMAVKLETQAPLTTGENVTVKLSGGAEIAGRVESNLNHQAIITVEDEGYAIGETVTVSASDGTLLGKGELYVHNAWKATAYSGTISAVNIKEEQVLSSGAAMFTLTDREYEGQLRRRASQHREYEGLLQRLLVMYESGCLTAPCTGTVSGVDEDSAHLLAAEDFDAQVTLLDGGDRGTVRLMLLSANVCTEIDTCTAGAGNHTGNCPKAICTKSQTCEASDQNHETDCIKGCTGGEDCKNIAGAHQSSCPMECKRTALCKESANHYSDCYWNCTEVSEQGQCPNASLGPERHKTNCIHKCTHGTSESGSGACEAGSSGKNHHRTCIESCDSAKTAGDSCDATGTHKVGCIHSCIKADVTGVCKPGTTSEPHYTDCIEACISSKSSNVFCPATDEHKSDCHFLGMTYKGYAGLVESVGTTEYVVRWDISGAMYDLAPSGSGWSIIGGDFNETNLVQKGGTAAISGDKRIKPGSIILVVTGYKGKDTTELGTFFYKQSSATAMPTMPDMSQFGDLSAMMGGFAGFGNYAGAAQQETENLYDTKGSPLLTVTAEEGYAVEISLDERDIHKVREGQEATIRVEAVKGQTFSGTVTRVGTIGTHAGGSGKYRVRVETGSIPGSLPGMSSMVRIHLETKADVLTLPVAAVSQDGAKTIVYTALDSKTGEPASPKEITTGASDGEMVEVMGLEEGTKVYYSYYDVLEIDDSAQARQFNMN